MRACFNFLLMNLLPLIIIPISSAACMQTITVTPAASPTPARAVAVSTQSARPLIYSVCVDNLNVRPGPAAAEGVLRWLPAGAQVRAYEFRGHWLRIDPLKSEWVNADYLCRLESNPNTRPK